MAIPSVIVSAMYAYHPSFVQLTYDATLVIAAMFFGTGLAFMVMPWRAKKHLGDPALPKGKIAGIPWMTVVAFPLLGLPGLQPGAVVQGQALRRQRLKSLIFTGCLYALAAVIWAVAAIVRRGRAWPSRRSPRRSPSSRPYEQQSPWSSSRALVRIPGAGGDSGSSEVAAGPDLRRLHTPSMRPTDA